MPKGVCFLPLKKMRKIIGRKRSRWRAITVVGVSLLDRLLLLDLESESEAFKFPTINMRSLDRSQSQETISERRPLEFLRCSLLHLLGNAPLADGELMGTTYDIDEHADDINGRAEISTILFYVPSNVHNMTTIRQAILRGKTALTYSEVRAMKNWYSGCHLEAHTSYFGGSTSLKTYVSVLHMKDVTNLTWSLHFASTSVAVF